MSEQLAAYLAFAARNYPFGVPSESIRRVAAEPVIAQSVVEGSGSSGIAFLNFGSIEGKESDLLNAALTKGLKIDPATACIVSIAEVNSVELNEIVKERKISTVIVFGQTLADEVQREWGEEEISIQFLISPTLSEILASPDCKREFWGHLQSAQVRSK